MNQTIYPTIKIYPNATIQNKTNLSFYWNYNITHNYTIGVIINSIIDGYNFKGGFILHYEGEPYNPSTHYFLLNSPCNNTHSEGEWNYFSCNIYNFLIEGIASIGRTYNNITISQITFYTFEFNQTGYFALDDLSIIHTSTTIIPKSNTYTTIQYVGIAIMIVIISFIAIGIIAKKK
jgi:hypothetical protein